MLKNVETVWKMFENAWRKIIKLNNITGYSSYNLNISAYKYSKKHFFFTQSLYKYLKNDWIILFCSVEKNFLNTLYVRRKYRIISHTTQHFTKISFNPR